MSMKVYGATSPSSADINRIGGISKGDLRAFFRWGALNLGYKSLTEVEGAPPTAELKPITEKYTQTDEIDMGMTYEELGMFGRLRKIFHCGPVSMFENLCIRWHGRLRPAEVAQKVKDFSQVLLHQSTQNDHYYTFLPRRELFCRRQ